MKRFLLQQLDQETLNRIDHQNQVQTLLEEIDFIRRVNDQEIKELQAMAARDTTNENREFFRNELASAIRDIRAEYDAVSLLLFLLLPSICPTMPWGLLPESCPST